MSLAKELAKILDRAEEVLGLAPDLTMMTSSTTQHHSSSATAAAAATASDNDEENRRNSLYTYQEDDTWEEFCQELPME